MNAQVKQAWSDAGRSGEPRLSALTYFGLGDEQRSRATLQNYYGFLTDYVSFIVEGALRTEQAVKDAVKAFEDAGVTELIFDPTVPESSMRSTGWPTSSSDLTDRTRLARL